MKSQTFEGAVENGQIRLDDQVTLPEKTKVYVLVPGSSDTTGEIPRIRSPRLANPKQIADFKKQMIQ
jgi:hypothetical protein